MKKIIMWSVLSILILFISGCKKTGYRIVIETDTIKYSDLLQVEAFFIEKGFTLEWKERKVDVPRYPNEVYTFLERKISNEPYHFVAVLISYVREITSNEYSKHIEIRIENWYKGMILPELKTEIDNLGDLIYQELASKVGKENVKIERKEVSPPVVY